MNTRFKGGKSAYLGRHIVTLSTIANQIQGMKLNKPSGVDGIPSMISDETAEYFGMSSKMFNLLLSEGIVPESWKEANMIKGQEF